MRAARHLRRQAASRQVVKDALRRWAGLSHVGDPDGPGSSWPFELDTVDALGRPVRLSVIVRADPIADDG